MVPMSLIVVEDERLSMRKIGVVVVVYTMKVRIEMLGARVIVARIHPV